MAKTCFIYIYLFIILCFFPFNLESSCVASIAYKEIGVKEATGNNDGERVNEYQKTTNTTSGASWCASFVKWCFTQCGIKTSITAWSPSAHNGKNIVYFKTKFLKEPRPGDVFTIYSIKQKRINHTGFYYSWYNERIYETVEGNTNIDGSNNGNGVYRRKRSYHTTYSITRWGNSN